MAAFWQEDENILFQVVKPYRIDKSFIKQRYLTLTKIISVINKTSSQKMKNNYILMVYSLSFVQLKSTFRRMPCFLTLPSNMQRMFSVALIMSLFAFYRQIRLSM